MSDEQQKQLAALRRARLLPELNGPTAVAQMHGIKDANWDMPENMMAIWNGYWDKPFDATAKTQVAEKQGNGGYMFRVGPNQATYSEDGMESFDVCRESSLQAFANLAPSVGEFWERSFPGFKVKHLT